jgi:hypothetical protein
MISAKSRSFAFDSDRTLYGDQAAQNDVGCMRLVLLAITIWFLQGVDSYTKAKAHLFRHRLGFWRLP